eukprot:3236439-Prymnesium_polylepis.2
MLVELHDHGVLYETVILEHLDSCGVHTHTCDLIEVLGPCIIWMEPCPMIGAPPGLAGCGWKRRFKGPHAVRDGVLEILARKRRA